jgi:short-subunit dehydrogenase
MVISATPKGAGRAGPLHEEAAYEESALFPALALVTGATSGIGEALVRLLAREGVETLSVGRNQGMLDSLPGKSLYTDLADDRSELIHWIQENAPDLIVNNAGFGLYGKGVDLSVDEQLRMVEVNNKALLEITLEAAKALLKTGKPGVILNVASAAAFQPFPTLAVYAATKAFVVSLSESLDYELKSRGIRVLVSCPGMVATDFQNRASGKAIKKNKSYMTADYAAERIWNQILNEKGLEIFDWKTHLLVRLGQFLIPNRFLAPLLKKILRRQ